MDQVYQLIDKVRDTQTHTQFSKLYVDTVEQLIPGIEIADEVAIDLFRILVNEIIDARPSRQFFIQLLYKYNRVSMDPQDVDMKDQSEIQQNKDFDKGIYQFRTSSVAELSLLLKIFDEDLTQKDRFFFVDC
jgi:hypothetical protein